MALTVRFADIPRVSPSNRLELVPSSKASGTWPSTAALRRSWWSRPWRGGRLVFAVARAAFFLLVPEFGAGRRCSICRHTIS